MPCIPYEDEPSRGLPRRWGALGYPLQPLHVGGVRHKNLARPHSGRKTAGFPDCHHTRQT